MLEMCSVVVEDGVAKQKKSGYSSSMAQSNGSDSQTQEQKNYGTKPKRRLNPWDSFGNISECSICGSRFHWAKQCLGRYEVLESVGEQAEEDKEVLITLFTNGSQSQNVTDETECDALLGETLGYGIIDSGCSKSVCGDVWLKCYLDTLSEGDIKFVQVEPGHTYFKFGDGAKIRSTKKVKFPAVIAGKRVCVSCDVISIAKAL